MGCVSLMVGVIVPGTVAATELVAGLDADQRSSRETLRLTLSVRQAGAMTRSAAAMTVPASTSILEYSAPS